YVQTTVERGDGSLVPLARGEGASGAWEHRHLRSFVLRGRGGRSGTSGTAQRPAVAGGSHRTADLELTLRGHPRSRASPVPQRHCYSQVLLSRVQGSTARTIAGTVRDRRQELEIFGERRPRTSELGEVRGRVPRAAGSHQYQRGALVRDSGRSQVVRAPARCRGDQR